MINKIIEIAMRERLLTVLLAAVIVAAGLFPTRSSLLMHSRT